MPMDNHKKIIPLFTCLFLFAPGLLAAKILVFGDFGTGDDKQKLVAQDMMRYCALNGCDFAITVGDNIYPNGVQNYYDGRIDFDKGTPNYKIITDYFVKNY